MNEMTQTEFAIETRALEKTFHDPKRGEGQAGSTIEGTMMTPSSSRKYGPRPDCANACTDATRPLRTLNVPKTASAKAASTSASVHSFSIPRRSCTIIECR